MKKFIGAILVCGMLASMSFAAVYADEPMVISPAPTENEVIVGKQQITVNGEKVDLDKTKLSQYIFSKNGSTMVPLRAVAEKMGYVVEWNEENQAVTVGNDTWEVILYIGDDSYVGVTKIKDAVGMTAPQSYGAAPEIVEDCTFVPAKMFELMGYKYSSVGQYVDFTNIHTITDKDGREYSNDILIISVAADAEESDILNTFKSNGLEVINKMDNLKMYTVRLEKPMTADEMDALITKLEKNKCILAANKDYIANLDEPVQIPNPFTEYNSVEDAKAAVSFDVVLPTKLPDGYEIASVSTMGSDFLQVFYEKGEGEIMYRVAVGSDDISGDYNTYKNVKTVKINGVDVTVRQDVKNSSVVWTDKGLTFALYANGNLSDKEITEIISSIK